MTVGGSRSNIVSASNKAQGLNGVEVSLELINLLLGANVPYSNDLVSASTGH